MCDIDLLYFFALNVWPPKSFISCPSKRIRLKFVLHAWKLKHQASAFGLFWLRMKWEILKHLIYFCLFCLFCLFFSLFVTFYPLVDVFSFLILSFLAPFCLFCLFSSSMVSFCPFWSFLISLYHTLLLLNYLVLSTLLSSLVCFSTQDADA